MEDLSLVLIGLGVLTLLGVFAVAIGNCIDLISIRTPKKQDYATLKQADRQFREILLPAVAALASGLFISISAAYFYETLESVEGNLSAVKGFVAFFVAVVLFVVVLKEALKNKGIDVHLSQNPAMIAATAEERVRNPSGTVPTSDFLAQRLEDWRHVKYVRALGIFRDKPAFRSDFKVEKLGCAFRATVDRSKWKRRILGPLQIYWAMLWHFPASFVWPILGILPLPLGMIAYLFVGAEQDPMFNTFATAVTSFISLMFGGFYVWSRVAVAWKTFVVNNEAEREAAHAVEKARAADHAAAHEAKLDRERQDKIDRFLARQDMEAVRRRVVEVSLGPVSLKVPLLTGIWSLRPSNRLRRGMDFQPPGFRTVHGATAGDESSLCATC